MAPYVDFHTHRRSGDALEILNVEALDAGAVARACQQGQPFSLGVHPWRADVSQTELQEAFSRIEQCVNVDGFVAIGECGLDWVSQVARAAQMSVFEQQIELAHRLAMPVVLHCVRAFEEVMLRLSQAKIERAVFHSFVGSPQQAERVVREGYFCSFSPRSLASPRTREVIKAIAPSVMLVERDECECSIEEVYEAVATLRKCSVEELREIVFDNYKRLIDNE
ncbi:MAG: TatD family hydrolase [Rikenellaceae bacterium]|nr:TatD family hydrolase [Rikenellaceae bacterium]